METDLPSLPLRARNWKKKNKKQIAALKSSKSLSADFNEAHVRVFQKTECLECANCCKTTGPLFTEKDTVRVAKHFKMPVSAFEDQYLRRDEDGDNVLKELPCVFLQEDNYCSIYDIRPKACREFPHTDMTNQRKIYNLTLKNAEVCPAVLAMFERITDQLK